MALVLIVVIIVVAVVAYIMVNRAANSGGKKRSILQRSVLDDLQMNTIRAAEISADVVPSQPTRRRLNRAQLGAPPNHEVEVAAKKRFVVDWEGVPPTGSDD